MPYQTSGSPKQHNPKSHSQVHHRLSELVSGLATGLTLPLLHLYSAEVFSTSRRFLLAVAIQVSSSSILESNSFTLTNLEKLIT